MLAYTSTIALYDSEADTIMAHLRECHGGNTLKLQFRIQCLHLSRIVGLTL